MANRRMFSLSVTDTDGFLDMPISSRLLYYELGMRADDDGFVSNWKKIIRFAGLAEDDMRVLISKKFIIPFDSGVIVIRHWRLNNYLRNDRYTPTIYQEEKSKLETDSNVYQLKDAEKTELLPSGIPTDIPTGNPGKDRLGKVSIDKDSIGEGCRERINYDEFVAIYSAECPKLPQVRLLTDKRRNNIRKFLNTYSLEDWKEICNKAGNSDFLQRQ